MDKSMSDMLRRWEEPIILPGFPRACFIADRFEKNAVVSDKTEEHPIFGPVTFYDINVGGVYLRNVSWEYKSSKCVEEDMKDWVGFRITSVWPMASPTDRIGEVTEPGLGVNIDYGMLD
ncbi:hypothetical protein BT63DRAFT_456782 [Microthyrium microscopicum]|uniref:Uncharacterized protein n=1 Tax=Microthyrium microscopicum TaxID=703497 RepID=A0A6A6U767_9PEZI|nr:hypothetical protein BT63DRAFT_456782 [Microthyrium microscopicum]